ncbi:MAG: hypothetical protein LBH94_00360, partial [Deltaproteobacteria bacterium]|nr:hypothetical protein [Deltaproteobacteria bacterium]
MKALGADYVGSPERVSDAQRTAVQTFACRCAHYFLDAFEQECPGDMRPRQAIEAAERFIRGEITRDALHAAAMLSYKAAEACHGDGTNAAINALRVFEITAETWVGIALAKNIEEASEAAREYFTQEFRDLCNLRGSYKLSLEDLADSSMKLSTTLNALQEVPFDRAVYVDKHTHNFESLLGALGKTKADDEELPCERIMDLIGLNNAVCALNAVDGHHNAKRLFSCYCAKYVLDLFERKYPDDKRPREAIATSERFARGQAGVEELDVAMSAAAAAREDAEDAVISPGTLSNRDLDAAWAALHAARAAELTVDAALAAGAVEWGADQD